MASETQECKFQKQHYCRFAKKDFSDHFSTLVGIEEMTLLVFDGPTVRESASQIKVSALSRPKDFS